MPIRSVLGFSFVFHDKAKRTQQGNLLGWDCVGSTVSEGMDAGCWSS